MKPKYFILSFFLFSCTKKIIQDIPVQVTDTILVSPPPPMIDTVDLFILAGQSNCGRPEYPGTGITGAPATDSERMIYDSAIHGFQIYNAAYDTLSFHDVQAGINTMLINYKYTDEMGPEVSFMRLLKDSSKLKQAFIIKYAVGNTDLASEWIGYYRYQLYHYVAKAMGILRVGKKVPLLKGIIWMQGENDAADSLYAADYFLNLRFFMEQFDDFFEDFCEVSGNPYNHYQQIIGQINGSQDPTETYRGLVRYWEETYTKDYPMQAALINTDNYPLFGGVHYTVEGQLMFGKDIYAALKDGL